MPTIPNLKLPDTSTTDAPAPMPPATPADYSGICRITDNIGGVSYLGSGVLISPDEVLTANHVVFHDTGTPGSLSNGLATALDVQPGFTPGVRSVDYNGTVTHSIDVVNEPQIKFSDIPTDYAIIHLSQPVIGAVPMHLLANDPGGSVHVSGYPLAGNGSLVDNVQTISADPSFANVFDGTGIGAGSSGGPVWKIGADGGLGVAGLISGATGTTGYYSQFTAAAVAQITSWVAQDDATNLPPVVVQPPPVVVTPTPPGPTVPTPQPPAPAHLVAVLVHDTTTNADVQDTLSQAYSGPVNGVATQFINLSPDNLNITATVPNMFIHSGSGDDAINVAAPGGTNLLDGGTGSNFLTGGSGADTFFVDDRGPTADIWSTVMGFHSGDAATVFGVSASGFAFDWEDNQGAVGAKGLTLHATAAGKPTASVTLAGFSKSDLAAGRIATAFGTEADGSTYLYVRAS